MAHRIEQHNSGPVHSAGWSRRPRTSAEVTYLTRYCVAQVLTLPSGERLIDVPVSRKVARLGAASRILKRVQRFTPDAYLVECRQRAPAME